MAATSQPIIPREVCTIPKSESDGELCFWLQLMGLEELRTAESIGVGVGDDIERLRSKARECGLVHRIDYVGTRVAVLDIFNADEASRSCLLSWIRESDPELEFSDERLGELLQTRHSEE